MPFDLDNLATLNHPNGQKADRLDRWGKIYIMKLTLLLIALFVPAAFAQKPTDCDLTDARTFYVMHMAGTPQGEQRKIDKALRQSSALKQANRPERADLLIDFTEPGWLNVWRGSPVERTFVGQWPLVGSSATATLSGSIRTTTVHTRRVTTSNTIISPPRAVTVVTSPEAHTASEFLFNLRVRRKICSH